jgi:hypothetical protein
MIRPVKQRDVVEFYGKPLPVTIHGVVSENEDGEVMGIAAYFIKGHLAILFSDIKDGISPKEVVRGTRTVLDLVKDRRLKIVALADEEHAPLLRHFGFEKDLFDPDYWVFSE